MTTKKQLQRNFAVSKEVEEKLLKLRNYHNKTYNSLFEILVENAYLSMEEAVNLHKGKELEEKTLQASFQVQQLTLMFAELKKEISTLNNDNVNLHKTIDVLKQVDTKMLSKVNDTIEEINLIKKDIKATNKEVDKLNKYNEDNKSWFKR